MRYQLQHSVKYRYDTSVVLEPHVLRMHLRSGPGIRLLSRELTIRPEPAGQFLGLGLEGQLEEVVWFQGATRGLSVVCCTEVETSPCDPFGFIMLPGYESLPFRFAGSLADTLNAYLTQSQPCADVVRFAAGILRDKGSFAPLFASELCAAMHDRFTSERRPTGAARSAAETWSLHSGACRDLAVLYVAAARSQGLPARFVSGYYLADESSPEMDLHAWAEVYLPGGGWRGFDPTTGLGVGETHLALASAPEAPGAAPVEGTFRGEASMCMEAHIEMRMA